MSNVQKKVAILVEDLYQVLEVWYPILRLKEDDICVHIIGSGTKKTYGSKEGYPVEVDFDIKEINVKDYDCVIIPGGWAPDIIRRFPEMVKFVKDIYVSDKIVASICHGGWLLVSADIVCGHRATSFFAIKDDLIAAGADYVDQEVVVDRNIITSRKPEDLTQFVVEIIKKLKS